MHEETSVTGVSSMFLQILVIHVLTKGFSAIILAKVLRKILYTCRVACCGGSRYEYG